MMRILGPLVSPTTSAVTATFWSLSALIVTSSPSTSRSGVRLTTSPALATILSISKTSPTATLCWRPPLRTIAYTPDLLSVVSAGSTPPDLLPNGTRGGDEASQPGTEGQE